MFIAYKCKHITSTALFRLKIDVLQSATCCSWVSLVRNFKSQTLNFENRKYVNVSHTRNGVAYIFFFISTDPLMEGNIALGKEKDTEYATQRYHKRHLNALCLLHLADCSVYPCSPRTINFYQFVFLAVFFFVVPPSRLLSHDQSGVN